MKFPIDDILVAVMFLVFIGGIAWVSIHSHRKKDDKKD